MTAQPTLIGPADDHKAKPDLNPMIDVVFQLLVFFLITMKFKTLDMKLDAWMPKHLGAAISTSPPQEPTLTARLARRAGERATRVKIANQTLGAAGIDPSVDDDVWAALAAKARATIERHRANDGDPAHVIGEVDASPLVPTATVIRAMDALVEGGIETVRFVGTPPPGRQLVPRRALTEK